MNESRRCAAHSSQTGQRCKKAAIKGGTVCASHGGRAPQVKRSAKERLEELVDPAIIGLRRAIKSDDISASVRASQIVLDRTGFHPSRSIELYGKDGGPIETAQTTIDVDSLTPEIRLALLQAIRANAADEPEPYTAKPGK